MENELRQELSTVSLELDTKKYPSERIISETGEATDTNSDASKGVIEKETCDNISSQSNLSNADALVDIQKGVPEKSLLWSTRNQ